MSERKQDYQARRLNFYNLSDEEEADNVIDLCLSDEEEAADDVINLCELDDTTNEASLLDALLPFDPLEGEGEGFTLNEPVCPPPTPTSWEDEPTILYGEGLLQ